MFEQYELLETLKMFREQNLDVRTLTLGISLFDCISDNPQVACQNIYDKITKIGKDLVATGKEIEEVYGVPIVNHRISVTPISLIAAAAVHASGFEEQIKAAKTYREIEEAAGELMLPYAKALDSAAKAIGVNFIGGFSALCQKGLTPSDKALMASLPVVLSETEHVCASINVASSKSGINMDAVRDLGPIIKRIAERTSDNQSFGCAKLVVFANAPEDNPFMAGAFTGPGEPDVAINVGVSGPGVILAALKNTHDLNWTELAELIKQTAFKVTRVGQLAANIASARLGIPFGTIDLSLAPTPAEGDSIANILEEIGMSSVGAWGSTAALAMLNDAVKKGGLMASSSVGGLSGAFIPVSEDQGMIDAVHGGFLSLEKLEAMTSVCSVGLDMVAVPGDTPATTISALIADEMAIGTFNNKTTAVRIIPVVGALPGDDVVYGDLWGIAPVMPVNPASSDIMIKRGGHIPAPIHSFKN